MPRVQSILSGALHAHHETESLEDNGRSKRTMVKFSRGWEKGAMIFVECMGVSQEEI